VTSPVEPVVPVGRLRELGQPTLPADGGLLLRPWAPGDVDVVLRAFADPDIQFWNLETLSTREAAADWLSQWGPGWQAERQGSWAVTDASSAAVLGRVALRRVHLAEGVAECTYWTLPEARGRAVASGAVRAVCRWAFEVLGLHRLELQHSTRNAPSCRVARRAGFAMEGTRREALRHVDGWHDMHLHSRVAGDP